MRRFPFIPLADGYSIKELSPVTNAHDLEGGFSYSALEFADMSWLVTCAFVLTQAQYDDFCEWYAEYIAAVFTEPFGLVLITTPEREEFIFTDHRANIMPDSLQVEVLAPHTYRVDLQLEAVEAVEEWLVSSKWNISYTEEVVGVSLAMLDGDYERIEYTTVEYDNYAPETVSVSFSMLDGEYSQIGYTIETYNNYAPETVSVSLSMLNGDYSQVEYTTVEYNNYEPETVSVSFAMIDGEYAEFHYTTRTYNNYAEETVSVSFSMLNGEYTETTI